MDIEPILVAGEWQRSVMNDPRKTVRLVQAANPNNRDFLPVSYPVTSWSVIERALEAAAEAFLALQKTSPEQRAQFLERFAERIQACAKELVDVAHKETALPIEPRLAAVELPRTINQLRLGAQAARERTWMFPTIDAAANIRSIYAPLGPVMIMGPNNFPFAYNAASGGDFVAAIAVGCPVVAKANPGHPGTTKRLAVEAFEAVRETGLPPATIQMFYLCENEVGVRLAKHPAIGAVAFTGSKSAGLALKKAADEAGKPIFLELGSINPVVFLPKALEERGGALAAEFAGSCLLGTGQFCTNPGLVLLIDGPHTEIFLKKTVEAFGKALAGPLLGERVLTHLRRSIDKWVAAGADKAVGGAPAQGPGFHYQNTLLRTSGKQFLAKREEFQTEAFGNAALAVVVADLSELAAVLAALEGNLTGSIYSHTGGADDAAYNRVEPILRSKVGRLLNDKMPTGVAVSPAMNHGGPFPASGNPGFTAVGIPASLRRFTALQCYDNVREDRLPPELRNRNTSPPIQRWIGTAYTQDDVS